MIDILIQNLEKGVKLLKSLKEEQYNNKSVAPFYSSIGGHMRHILDVYKCVLNGLETNEVDLTARERNIDAETYVKFGLAYFEQIITGLESLRAEDLTKTVAVTDNLGDGKYTITYTLGAILAQAQSHTTHHYASVGYIMHHLGVELPDNDFGVNPTTPKEQLVKQAS